MRSSENFEVWNGLELDWSQAFPRALAIEAVTSTATADSDGHLICHFHKELKIFPFTLKITRKNLNPI